MWFKFPPNVTNISIEMQHFAEEFKDEAGSYFRAPNHFAPIIKGLNAGFETLPVPPRGAPDDIPTYSLPVGSADITKQMTTLQLENQGLREDLGAALGQIRALTGENGTLAAKLAEAVQQILTLQQKIDDAGLDEPEPPKKK